MLLQIYQIFLIWKNISSKNFYIFIIWNFIHSHFAHFLTTFWHHITILHTSISSLFGTFSDAIPQMPSQPPHRPWSATIHIHHKAKPTYPKPIPLQYNKSQMEAKWSHRSHPSWMDDKSYSQLPKKPSYSLHLSSKSTLSSPRCYIFPLNALQMFLECYMNVIWLLHFVFVIVHSPNLSNSQCLKGFPLI